MNGRFFSSEWRYLVAGLIALDAAGLIGAMGLAYYVRFVWQVVPYTAPFEPEFYLSLILTTTPLWLVLFWMHRLYDARSLLGGFREYALVANASTYGAVMLVVLVFIEHQDSSVSRGWIIMVWILSVFVVGGLRFAARRVAYGLRRRGLFVRRAIVVGADEQGVALASHLSPSHWTGVNVVGLAHEYLAPGSIVGEGFRVLGEPMDLAEMAREHDVDLVIIIPGALSWESLQTVMQLAADGEATFECRILPGLYDVIASGVEIDQRGPVPLLSLKRIRITGFDAVLKGILDYVGAPLVILLTLPLFILLAVSTGRKGKNPIEGREHLGVNGRPFRALAFQGWWNDEAVNTGSALERFFYERRLHCLAGLLNVLKGEMSLVGPRLVTTEELLLQPKWRHSLLSVKPGLTGPWLLAGGGKLPLEESLRLDLHYIRNYSIWLDLQMLFQTLIKLLRNSFQTETLDSEELPSPLPRT